MTISPQAAIRSLWEHVGLAEPDLTGLQLEGSEPVLPSSFAVGTAAQV